MHISSFFSGLLWRLHQPDFQSRISQFRTEFETEPVFLDSRGADFQVKDVAQTKKSKCPAEIMTSFTMCHLSPIYTNSGASDFCHVRLILPGCLSNFARLSDRFWDGNFPISLSDFVQCDVCRSDAYKNWTDGLAKLVIRQKLDRFWLFV